VALPASIEPLDSQIHEVWGFPKVPVGIFNKHVTEISREDREASLNIFPRAIPIHERVHGKSLFRKCANAPCSCRGIVPSRFRYDPKM
jgi:hypothetical protein